MISFPPSHPQHPPFDVLMASKANSKLYKLYDSSMYMRLKNGPCPKEISTTPHSQKMYMFRKFSILDSILFTQHMVLVVCFIHVEPRYIGTEIQ